MSEPREVGKRTALGLYVTAAEAYEEWKASPDPEKIMLAEGTSKQTVPV